MLTNPPVDVSHRLSVATSIALRRLADRQKIRLISVADAPARIFDFGVGEVRFSHVARRDDA
jgi:hypothetical protein